MCYVLFAHVVASDSGTGFPVRIRMRSRRANCGSIRLPGTLIFYIVVPVSYLSDDDRFFNRSFLVSPTDLPEPRGVLREPALGGDCGNAHLPGVHSDGVGPPLGACLAHHQQQSHRLTGPRTGGTGKHRFPPSPVLRIRIRDPVTPGAPGWVKNQDQDPDPGSGSGSYFHFFGVKILKFFHSDPGSGINIPDPQHCLSLPLPVTSALPVLFFKASLFIISTVLGAPFAIQEPLFPFIVKVHLVGRYRYCHV
jgi:hypothetical protein